MFREAVKSWSHKQHLMVFLIGLGLITGFAALMGLVALAYINPGAFVAFIALVVLSYLVGTFFSVVLLGRGVEE